MQLKYFMIEENVFFLKNMISFKKLIDGNKNVLLRTQYKNY